MKNSGYRCLRPVLVFGRLAAVYPQSETSFRKVLLYFYFCFYSTIVFASSVLTLTWLYYSDLPSIHLFLRKCQTAIAFTNFAVTFGTSLWHNKNLVSVLKRLEDVDKELATLGIFIKYKNDSILKVLIFRVTLQIFLLVLELSLSRPVDYTIFYVVSKYLIQFSVTAFQMQAYALLKFVGNHFSILNEKMQEMKVHPSWDKILCFVRLYDILKHKALSVNEYCSLSTIFSLLSCFFYVIVTLHLLATSRTIHIDSFIILFVVCISFVLFKIYEIWISIEPFVNVTNKVYKFNATLFKIMVSDKVGQYVGNDKLQLHISLNQDIAFSAAGFFTLDYSLIHSIIGAIATFLVILVQFDQKDS